MLVLIKLFPEVVSSDRDMMAINYDAFGVLAIQAIQEQQVIITNQQMKIGEFEDAQSNFISRLDVLERQLESLLSDKK